MTETPRWELVAFDAADIDTTAAFYRDLAGWQITRSEPDWVVLTTATGDEVAFQLAPDHRSPEWPGQAMPQQLHLDLIVDGHLAAAERAVSLGATRLGDGATWVTLADPAGHPFDLCQRDGAGQGISMYAVTFDAPDTSSLAAFYAALLGADVTYDGPEGAMVSGAGKNLMFQRVSDYTAPHWPDPARPQQGHLDLAVTDLDAGEAFALATGAVRLSGVDDDNLDSFRVFADPAGHPFCLTS